MELYTPTPQELDELGFVIKNSETSSRLYWKTDGVVNVSYFFGTGNSPGPNWFVGYKGRSIGALFYVKEDLTTFFETWN